MRISIVHRTVYRYAGEIVHSAQYLRLTPGSNPSQQVRSWHIGAPGQLTPWRDAFGNRCHTLVVERLGREIVIVAPWVRSSLTRLDHWLGLHFDYRPW